MKLKVKHIISLNLNQIQTIKPCKLTRFFVSLRTNFKKKL